MYLPDGKAVIPGAARRTIALYGDRYLRANCTLKVICSSADNSKAAFEAAKPSCKIARDAIARTQADDSAAKRTILTGPSVPKTGMRPTRSLWFSTNTSHRGDRRQPRLNAAPEHGRRDVQDCFGPDDPGWLSLASAPVVAEDFTESEDYRDAGAPACLAELICAVGYLIENKPGRLKVYVATQPALNGRELVLDESVPDAGRLAGSVVVVTFTGVEGKGVVDGRIVGLALPPAGASEAQVSASEREAMPQPITTSISPTGSLPFRLERRTIRRAPSRSSI